MIYADHAATTALSPAVCAAMQPWLREKYGNPSALGSSALEARRAIETARATVSDCIGAKPEEVYFTSGGTEADNWALTGAAFRSPDRRGRIIASGIEHHAVLHTCDFLRRMGYAVDLLPVDGYGLVHPETLESCLASDTLLVSVMLASNEIGTLQPVERLAARAHEHGCLFHTDAVQAVGHVPIDVGELGVDMLSASAHKFNGPKGTGFLYIRSGVDIEPFIHGGAQERGRRAGTENVAGIVGMAEALSEHIEHMAQEARYLISLTDALLAGLRSTGLDFIVNGSADRIPGSLSISFRQADGEMLLHRLDLMGTAIATGSACDSKSAVLSHVIRAIGVPEAYARGTVRITLGMDNDMEQVETIVRQICAVLRAHR